VSVSIEVCARVSGEANELLGACNSRFESDVRNSRPLESEAAAREMHYGF